MLCTRVVLPSLLEQGQGRIVKGAAGGGLVGQSVASVYERPRLG
jgi:hypothetical protein